MRVWLVDDKRGETSLLQAELGHLANHPGSRVTLLGMAPYRPDFAAAMRSLMPELIVINEDIWPREPATQEALGLGPGVVMVAAAQRREQLRHFAERYPLVFVPPAPGAEVLGAALLSAWGRSCCHLRWQEEAAELRQRLNDRVVIERAKGILVQHLGIPEDEAYRRLRGLSRRQRRPMRDIAQALLDTRTLLGPGAAGLDLLDDLSVGDEEEALPARCSSS